MILNRAFDYPQIRVDFSPPINSMGRLQSTLQTSLPTNFVGLLRIALNNKNI